MMIYFTVISLPGRKISLHNQQPAISKIILGSWKCAEVSAFGIIKAKGLGLSCLVLISNLSKSLTWGLREEPLFNTQNCFILGCKGFPCHDCNRICFIIKCSVLIYLLLLIYCFHINKKKHKLPFVSAQCL